MAAMTDVPVPRNGSRIQSPALLRESTNRSISSTGNWQGCSVFSTWLLLTFGITHKSPGFLPSGLQEYWPVFGPLKYFFPGYFWGIRTGSRLKTYSSDFVNHIIVSY